MTEISKYAVSTAAIRLLPTVPHERGAVHLSTSGRIQEAVAIAAETMSVVNALPGWPCALTR